MEKCLVIGSTVCDIMIYIDKLPKTEEDIHLKKQLISLGGCAFNAVSVLHNLNIPYTFVSPVGKGMYGDFVRNELNKRNIKTEVFLEEENGCCYCLIEESGERTFMSYHKAEYTFNPKWLDNLNLDEYKYIYVCGLEIEDVNGKELVSVLNKFKGEVVFAGGPRVNYIDKALLEEIYKVKPILHLNEKEAVILGQSDNLNDSVVALYNKTGNAVIVTLGDKGSLYYDGTFRYVPGYKAAVVDTVGAGDSHAGGFIASRFRNKSMEEALDFANLLASKVVGSAGINLSEKDYNFFANLLWK